MFRTSAFAMVQRALLTALDALVRHPLRAFLTGFGVLVGVTSVTLVITLGEGAERSVEKNVQNLGENLVSIRPRAPESNTSVAKESAPLLTESDAAALARDVRAAAHAAPVLDSMVRTVFRDKNQAVQAVGATLPYFAARKYKLSAGALWDETQETLGARVCLIGPTVVEKLFPGVDPVGANLRVKNHLFRVLGVLAEKGQTSFGTDQDNIVVVPLAAMRSKLQTARPGEATQIFVQAKAGENTATLTREITKVLRERHGRSEDQEDDFDVRDQARMAESQRAIVGIMRILLLCMAGVSLVIGGIGVMNIMMVSVTERSREIGTRLAIGARSGDILSQFLIEAVLLALVGGGLGALLSALLTGPLEAYFGWELWISETGLSVALGTSIVLGLVFGFLPARRASLMDPVAALRRD